MRFYWGANRQICHRDSVLSRLAETAEEDGEKAKPSNMAASERGVFRRVLLNRAE